VVDGEGERLVKKGRFGKDPTVETSFLPDKDREIRERAQREQLKQEWLAKQERIKKERLNVTYSYWDGSGHRREIIIPKGGCPSSQ
jgi:protein FAM50